MGYQIDAEFDAESNGEVRFRIGPTGDNLWPKNGRKLCSRTEISRNRGPTPTLGVMLGMNSTENMPLNRMVKTVSRFTHLVTSYGQITAKTGL